MNICLMDLSGWRELGAAAAAAEWAGGRLKLALISRPLLPPHRSEREQVRKLDVKRLT